jgi:hypothetical protein
MVMQSEKGVQSVCTLGTDLGHESQVNAQELGGETAQGGNPGPRARCKKQSKICTLGTDQGCESQVNARELARG